MKNIIITIAMVTTSVFANAKDFVRIDPPGLIDPPTHTQILISSRRKKVYISGQTAIDQQGQLVGGNSLAKQSAQVIKNLDTALKAAKAGFSDVVKMTIYIKNLSEDSQAQLLEGASAAFSELKVAPPHTISTLIGVSALSRPEYLIEIEMIAELD